MLVGWRVRGVDCGVAFFAVCCAVAAAACDVVFAFVLAAVAGGRGGCLLVCWEVYVARWCCGDPVLAGVATRGDVTCDVVSATRANVRQ